MIFKHIGLALVGAALLLAQAQATFQFNDCVGSCITSSGCKTDSARCMCREARELLLDSVISCLFFNCKSDLRTFDDAFLKPIEEGCADSHRRIPKSKLKAAERMAHDYISRLPAPTTAEPAPTPKPTSPSLEKPTSSFSSSSSSTTTKESTPSHTSSADRAIEDSTSAADRTTTTAAATTTTAPTRAAAAPTSATTTTQSSATTPSQSSAASNSGSNFDTNPFGSSSSAGSAGIRPLLSLLGLPLALGIMALLR
ncbi:hypothetical protein C8A00DRAFT_39586 [Chaetomidium leptoderma]|uniref:Extracellular membrane protein CFEM domain-containing protein n=1 Tax=Chaetomidium leptoderma TaxID=669021 RepID=A0AAN6ZZX6_9PEZI|nr:hypothetical protein C8A00DRAFT_39586 [Chaetomidium leptoderma]